MRAEDLLDRMTTEQKTKMLENLLTHLLRKKAGSHPKAIEYAWQNVERLFDEISEG
jgi:hypothetical protein